VRWIGYLLPLTYFTIISQGVMLRGAPITSMWYAYLILAIMAAVVFTAATLRFRRDLAPGGRSPGHRTAAAAVAVPATEPGAP
jgi:ABC-2 type transport system permease protein